MTKTPETLDLRGIPCPRNTAQALMKLQMADDGDHLNILVDDGEPFTNMMESFELEPEVRILGKEPQDGNYWLVRILKSEE